MTFYPLQFSTVPSPSSVPPLGPSCARRGDASARCFVSAAAGAAARSGSGLSLTHWQMRPGVCAAPAACCFVLLAVLLCFIRTDVDVVRVPRVSWTPPSWTLFPNKSLSLSESLSLSLPSCQTRMIQKFFPGQFYFALGYFCGKSKRTQAPFLPLPILCAPRPSASRLIARRTRRANASRPPVNCDEVCQ